MGPHLLNQRLHVRHATRLGSLDKCLRDPTDDLQVCIKLRVLILPHARVHSRTLGTLTERRWTTVCGEAAASSPLKRLMARSSEEVSGSVRCAEARRSRVRHQKASSTLQEGVGEEKAFIPNLLCPSPYPCPDLLPPSPT